MVRDTGDEDAYSRARRDPDFLEAVRHAYAGPRDALNALWWMSHPAESAPDGTPSPLDQLRDLQRRVFSASGGSLGDPDATAALRELEAELSAEGEAIKDAVEAADQGHGPGLESLFPVGVPESTSPDEGSSAGRGHLLVVVGLVAAMAGGMVIGAQWSGGRVDASPSVTPSAPPPPVTAEETCGQIGDVLTLGLNAGISRRENRSTEQEWQGAVVLASRMLGRVDTADGTELSERVDEWKAIASSVSATVPGLVAQTSPEWNVAFHKVWMLCDAAGIAVSTPNWTGG